MIKIYKELLHSIIRWQTTQLKMADVLERDTSSKKIYGLQ